MSIAPRTIAKNTGFYITALAVQKIISFVYFSYLARNLGAENTGQYFYALSIAAVVMVFMDLGMTPLLTREVAKHPDRARADLSDSLTLKVLVTIVVCLIYTTAVALTIDDPAMVHLLYIALAISVMDSFAMTLFGTVRAFQNLSYESFAAILFYIIVIIFGVSAIVLRADLRVIMLALFAASIANALYALFVLFVKFNIRPTWNFSRRSVAIILTASAPFALAAIFTKVNAYIDTILLNYLTDAATVGLYSVAYKLTFAMQFIPMAFAAALYPAYASYWQHSREQLAVVVTKSLQYLLILSMPITFGVAAVAYQAIPHIYTNEFMGSAQPLVILITSLPFLFLNFPIGSLLNACNRHSRQTWHQGIAMIASVALNAALIPRWGAVGAATASTLGTIFMFFLGLAVLRSITLYDRRAVLATLIKLCVICVLMYGLTVLLLGFIAWYLAVVSAAALYIYLVLATRAIDPRDARIIKSLARR